MTYHCAFRGKGLRVFLSFLDLSPLSSFPGQRFSFELLRFDLGADVLDEASKLLPQSNRRFVQ